MTFSYCKEFSTLEASWNRRPRFWGRPSLILFCMDTVWTHCDSGLKSKRGQWWMCFRKLKSTRYFPTRLQSVSKYRWFVASLFMENTCWDLVLFCENLLWHLPAWARAWCLHFQPWDVVPGLECSRGPARPLSPGRAPEAVRPWWVLSIFNVLYQRGHSSLWQNKLHQDFQHKNISNSFFLSLSFNLYFISWCQFIQFQNIYIYIYKFVYICFLFCLLVEVYIYIYI